MDDSRIINVTRLDLNIDVAPRFWTYDVMPEPSKNGKVYIIYISLFYIESDIVNLSHA